MMNYMSKPEEARFYTEQVFGMIADGSLKITISQEYPFTAEAVQQAHKDLTGGKTVGKLVVKVADE